MMAHCSGCNEWRPTNKHGANYLVAHHLAGGSTVGEPMYQCDGGEVLGAAVSDVAPDKVGRAPAVKIELRGTCPACKAAELVKKSADGYETRQHREHMDFISHRGAKCPGGPVSSENVIFHARKDRDGALRTVDHIEKKRAEAKADYEAEMKRYDDAEREARARADGYSKFLQGKS